MTNILIIEPSTSGLRLLPHAKAMKLNIFVLSANSDERIISDHYKKFIDELVIVDTNDIGQVTQVALELHQSHPLSAVIPGFELYVPHAAQVSRLVKAPGVTIETGEALRNKNKMLETLQRANVRVPRFMLIDTNDKITELLGYLAFPCVIKPVDQSGSIHVSRVNNEFELRNAYTEMCNDTWTEMQKGVGHIAIVEEYIEGEEFSVEGYVQDSEIHIISITKKFLTPEPLFIEMGHIVTANLNENTQIAIENYVHEVVKALKINLGVFHAELRVDGQGPVLMEIAGRLPGCRIPDLIQLAKGINFYEIMIKSHLGWPITLENNYNQQYAGMCYFELDGKETFHHVNGIDALSDAPGFQEFKLLKNPGEFIPPLKDFQGRVGYCIFTAPTYEQLLSMLNQSMAVITFE